MIGVHFYWKGVERPGRASVHQNPVSSSPSPHSRTLGGGGGVLPFMGIRGCATQQGMVFASLSLEQGLQIRAFLSGTGYTFCHATLEHGRGYFFAARITLQTNVVSFPLGVLLHVYSNTPFPIRRSTAFRIFSVWNRVSIFTILSGTG